MKTLLFCLTVLSASAAPTSNALAEDKEAARREYGEGTRRYDLNEFGPALEAFRRAYLNYEDPAFLFNIAQCHRQLGHKAEAIQFYRSYLRKRPDAANRDEVNNTVASLEAALATEKAEHPTPPVVTERATPPASVAVAPEAIVARPMPPPRTPVYKKWWLWTIVGVAAAGAAVGLGVGLTSSQHTEGSLMPVTAAVAR